MDLFRATVRTIDFRVPLPQNSMKGNEMKWEAIREELVYWGCVII